MRSSYIVVTIVLAAGCASTPKPPTASASTDRRVEVCVVDTVAPGGMMTISAIHNTATNDTLVLDATGRVPIEQVVAGPKVWTSTAIQLRTSAGSVRFAPTGQPKAFTPAKITLLGVLNGLPVFANPGDASPIRAEIEALAATGVDLDQALEKRLPLRRGMDRIRTLYVPTSLVNCTFQTLTRSAPRRR